MCLQCHRQLSRTSLALTPSTRCPVFFLQFLTCCQPPSLPPNYPLILQMLTQCGKWQSTWFKEKELRGKPEDRPQDPECQERNRDRERRQESKWRNTRTDTVDKDRRNQMQAGATKLKRRRKEEPTTTRLPVLDKTNLVSATTYEISLSQANLYLVPWWNKKFNQKSLKLQSKTFSREETLNFKHLL